MIDRTRVTDWTQAVHQATGGQIIDAVMDLAGGEMTNALIDTMIGRMSERSSYPRLSIAGASDGNVTRILWTRIYLYQVQVFGVSHGTRDEADQLIAWIRSGALRPVLQGAFRLSDIHRAEDYFADRNADYVGKIVIVPDSEWDAHGQPFAIA